MMLSAFQSLLIILLPAPVLMSSLSIQTSCMTCLYLPPAFSHLPFTSELQSGFRLYYLLKTKLARVLHNLLVTKHVDPFQSISLVLLNMRQYEYSFEQKPLSLGLIMVLASHHFSELSFLGSTLIFLSGSLLGLCYLRVPTELFVWHFEEVPGEGSSTLMASPISIPLTANLVPHLSPFLYATP